MSASTSGHLVPANHADNSTDAIRQSNTMTNALPQASNMNRGAWLQTEEIAECYRDIEPVTVIGGVIWGDNPRTDCVATRKRLDQYLVSIAELEARTGETIPVDDWRKEDVPEVSWMIPVGYDRW